MSAYFSLHHGHVVTADARLDQCLVHRLNREPAVLRNRVVVADPEVDLGWQPLLLRLGCDVIDGLIQVVVIHTDEADDLRTEEHAGEEVLHLAYVGEVVGGQVENFHVRPDWSVAAASWTSADFVEILVEGKVDEVVREVQLLQIVQLPQAVHFGRTFDLVVGEVEELQVDAVGQLAEGLDLVEGEVQDEELAGFGEA